MPESPISYQLNLTAKFCWYSSLDSGKQPLYEKQNKTACSYDLSVTHIHESAKTYPVTTMTNVPSLLFFFISITRTMIIKYITTATNVDRVNTIHAAVFVVVAAGPGS